MRREGCSGRRCVSYLCQFKDKTSKMQNIFCPFTVFADLAIWQSLIRSNYPGMHPVKKDFDECRHHASIQVSSRAAKQELIKFLFIAPAKIVQLHRKVHRPGPHCESRSCDLRGHISLDGC